MDTTKLPAALDLPADLSMKGCKIWLNEVRMYLFTLPPGSETRSRNIVRAQGQFGYAEFICRRNPRVVKFLAEEAGKLTNLLHTHADTH